MSENTFVEINNHKAYVANGYCFYTAAKQLGTVSFKNGQANLLSAAQNLVPATVNYAFAAELGLKAIIQNEKGDIKHIHKLDKLLAELSDSTRQFLLLTVSSSLSITEDAVRTLIQNHANTFADWRYFVFNNKKIEVDFLFLVKFCDAIYQYIGKGLQE